MGRKAEARMNSLRAQIDHRSYFSAPGQLLDYGDFLESPNNKGLRNET
jgi:hypothetical protein|tara:strand:- start:1385 stop:1528 length:144 start_codon:yes stop_codon:yes gene_type:complete